MFFKGRDAKKRFSNLLDLQPDFSDDLQLFDDESGVSKDDLSEDKFEVLSRYFEYADVPVSPYVACVFILVIAVVLLFFSFLLFPVYLAPLFVLLLAVTVYVFLEKRVEHKAGEFSSEYPACLLYTSPSPRDATLSRMPSSA